VGERRKVSIWIKLFVLFHLIAITVWAMPMPPDAIKDERIPPSGTNWLVYWNYKYLKTFPLLYSYPKVTGFWQYWDMFAPNPTRTDQWCDAVVTYRDGATKRYEYPRMFDLSIGQKFIKERYRKFYERAGNAQFLYLWPTFGLRVALINDNKANPPVEVKLFRHWRLTAEPGKQQVEAYDGALYYTYIVDQKELARLRTLGL